MRVVADALHLLRQEHQEKLRVLEETMVSDREALEKEMAEARKQWEREQAEYELLTTENRQRLSQERQKQEADYQYDTERSRHIATDNYEEARRKLDHALQEKRRIKEKDWTEREQILAANQSKLEEYQHKMAAFPNELEEATKKAREEAIREINQQEKVKADLLTKEWEGSQQAYQQQIQSLENRIQKQLEQISDLSSQLQATMQQAQELAMRAFNNSAPRLAGN